MGKRSEGFTRFPQDAYQSPIEAVRPLLPHLSPGTAFVEPCCGEGKLIAHLVGAGHTCVGRYDLPCDAREHRYRLEAGDIFITNPPWKREVMHPIIVNLSDQADTWILLEWDWLATLQSGPFGARMRKIIPFGRLKWVPGTEHLGKQNHAWVLFSRPVLEPTIFIPRQMAATAGRESEPRRIGEMPHPWTEFDHEEFEKLRQRVTTLERELTSFEQQRADVYYGLAAWSARQLGFGPLSLTERTLVHRVECLCDQRLGLVPQAKLVPPPPVPTPVSPDAGRKVLLLRSDDDDRNDTA
jgi:hypothetical protein